MGVVQHPMGCPHDTHLLGCRCVRTPLDHQGVFLDTSFLTVCCTLAAIRLQRRELPVHGAVRVRSDVLFDAFSGQGELS